ncbi:MAG: glycosyltransferase family 2 protein [Cetobacterium sp.]|uniref:glycosyltransferase family 2 protein n=1 Tax=Cetobacterium sp. TaxID=2071632 RepID=UPI002FC641C8
MKKEEISIITVCYNSENTIQETFESLLNQSDLDFEYIIVDGNSKDNTLNLIKEYKKKFEEKKIRFRYISEKDEGIYDAMNKGINLAEGCIIGILNSDDCYEKNTIKIVKEQMLGKKEMILHGKMNLLLENGEKKTKVPKLLKSKYLNFGMIFFHPTFFVTKDIYIKIGGFNKHFRVAGDFDFTYRAYKNNIKFKYLDFIFTNFRLGGESTNNSNIGFEECKAVLINNGKNKIFINALFNYKKLKTKLYNNFLLKDKI